MSDLERIQAIRTGWSLTIIAKRARMVRGFRKAAPCSRLQETRENSFGNRDMSVVQESGYDAGTISCSLAALKRVSAWHLGCGNGD